MNNSANFMGINYNKGIWIGVSKHRCKQLALLRKCSASYTSVSVIIEFRRFGQLLLLLLFLFLLSFLLLLLLASKLVGAVPVEFIGDYTLFFVDNGFAGSQKFIVLSSVLLWIRYSHLIALKIELKHINSILSYIAIFYASMFLKPILVRMLINQLNY